MLLGPLLAWRVYQQLKCGMYTPAYLLSDPVSRCLSPSCQLAAFTWPFASSIHQKIWPLHRHFAIWPLRRPLQCSCIGTRGKPRVHTRSRIHRARCLPSGDDAEGESAEIHLVLRGLPGFLFHQVICNFTCVLITKWALTEQTPLQSTARRGGPSDSSVYHPLEHIYPQIRAFPCAPLH